MLVVAESLWYSKTKNVGSIEDKSQTQDTYSCFFVWRCTFICLVLCAAWRATVHSNSVVATTATETTVSIGVCEEHCVERLAVSLAQ